MPPDPPRVLGRSLPPSRARVVPATGSLGIVGPAASNEGAFWRLAASQNSNLSRDVASGRSGRPQIVQPPPACRAIRPTAAWPASGSMATVEAPAIRWFARHRRLSGEQTLGPCVSGLRTLTSGWLFSAQGFRTWNRGPVESPRKHPEWGPALRGEPWRGANCLRLWPSGRGALALGRPAVQAGL